MRNEKLIGRESECARLESFLTGIDIAPRALAIVGPAGAGKTTLASWARERAAARRITCAIVRVPPGSVSGRVVVAELFDKLRSAHIALHGACPAMLEDLCVALQRPLGDEQEVNAFRLANVLEAAADAGPVLVGVDDFHRLSADPSELLLAALKVSEAPIGLILTVRTRDDGEEPSLPTSDSDLLVDRIPLTDLPESATNELTEHILRGRATPSLHEAVYRSTAGNPLFVVELLRSWLDQALLTKEGERWTCTETAEDRIPATLTESVRARFERLDPRRLDIARVVAFFGRSVALDELQSACEEGSQDLAAALEDLCDDGILVRQSPGLWGIAHPLYVGALVDGTAAARKGAISRRVFELLEERHARGLSVPAAEIAHHAWLARDPPKNLTDLLEAAAEEAFATDSVEEAARWRERLAETVASDQARLASTLFRWGYEISRTKPDEALRLYDRVLQLDAPEAPEPRVLLFKAVAHRYAGRVEQALELLEKALPQASDSTAGAIEANLASFPMLLGRLDESEAALTELQHRAPDSMNLQNLALIAFYRGELLRSCDLFARSIAEAEQPRLIPDRELGLAWSQAFLGRWDEADATYREAIERFKLEAEPWRYSVAIQQSAWLAAWRGDEDRALDESSRALRLAERLSNRVSRIWAKSTYALAGIECGLPHVGYAQLVDELAIPPSDEEVLDICVAQAIAGEAALLTGDAVSAARWWRTATDAMGQARIWAQPIDRLGAQISLYAGLPAEALQRIYEWLQTPGPIRFEHARILELAGEAHRSLGDVAAAEASMEEASSIYVAMGAQVRAANLSHHLERPRRRPRAVGPAGLTARELEIVLLVVEGLTNAEVARRLTLSAHTVKKHVENILTKTGARRRGDLSRFVGTIEADLR